MASRSTFPISARPLVAAMVTLAAVTALAWAQSPRLALLLWIGAALGATLYHAAFGFATAYRRLLAHRETFGVDAQIVMLAVASVLFAPLLAQGTFAGAVAPLGAQVVAGAFLFGIGMQLANGCGSGTLYALGGGSRRMLWTLPAFVAGAFWASLHMAGWQALPSAPPIVLGDVLGWPAAVAVQLAVLAGLWRALAPWRRRQAAAAGDWHPLVGPWPLVGGGVLLAVLNAATLVVAGHPWSITWAFTLWGAKLAMHAGWDPASSAFWQGDFQQSALHSSVLGDTTSIMDFGLVLGAAVAAVLAGRFGTPQRLPVRAVAAAWIGGLLMGYGARIAFGCNVGAFFSGVASTSLHGWLWMAAALPGVWLGIRLRPVFGLAG